MEEGNTTGSLKEEKVLTLKIWKSGSTPSVFVINYYEWKVVITMNEKLSKYLDGLFAPYEDTHAVEDLKEELLHDLQEKFRDLKDQGHDDETAYQINTVI